ncbi:PrsW family intramembrane metalloprotease [Streptomyces justiciae]|uniref:PrsW family intramembrane metalloprotease n=1 Tax=Streptomyces justiciae TaxID=2780140 RepID=UPI00187F5B5C|nr:PrsW family intramembrane metalloprotease [Streptomyces justiciae]MBE8478306.1 PrsW family intramembrane metalloprotease [Streptomyces justiciae]MCW8384429.1 PrsW family intramembrane metalloprotease [Streptomyces justiciae]
MSDTQNSVRRDHGRLVQLGRRWGWLAVLAVGLLLFWLIHSALISTGNPNLVPALLFFGASLVPAAFVSFVAGRRLDFGVGSPVVGVTALVGGAIGVTTAGFLEYRTLILLDVLPMAAVGVIEEAAKLVMPLVLLLFIRRRSPGDGLLIGVASGAGFAVFETMGYAFVELVQSGGDLHVVDHLLVVRGLLSPAAHMAWTGLTSAALWSAAEHHWRRRSVGVLVLVYAVAVGLHTAWDSFDDDTAYAVLAAVSLSLLVYTTHRLAGLSRSAGAALATVSSTVAPTPQT